MPQGPSPYQPPDDPRHDLGPWVEAPSSSRITDYRYDYATGELQVRWRNRPPTEGYLYSVGSPQILQNFARAASKGKMINRVLDGFGYRPMTPEEVQAPANPQRSALTSRVRR